MPLKKLHWNATLPSLATPSSVWFDITNILSITLPQELSTIILLETTCVIPKGLYLCIECNSCLSTAQLSMEGGVFDNNYCNEIKLILQKHHNQPYHFPQHSKTAQAIFEKVNKPVVIPSHTFHFLLLPIMVLVPPIQNHLGLNVL